jgi:MipA family protein
MTLRFRTLLLSAPAALAGVVLLSTSASAQDTAENRNELTVIVGAATVPSYGGSDENVIVPGAVIRGRVADFPFFTRGPSLYIDAIPNRSDQALDLEFGPVVNLRSDRHNNIKDPQVQRLGKLKRAVELGGWVGIGKTGVFTSAYDNLSFRVAYLNDVNDAHHSYIISPSLEYGTPLSETTFVGVSVSADYVGKGFGRTYYDVTPAGTAASGLRTYSAAGAKSGFSKVSGNLVAAQSLSGDLRKGWALFATGGYGRMLGRYADSPLVRDVGSRDQWMGALGIGYTF